MDPLSILAGCVESKKSCPLWLCWNCWFIEWWFMCTVLLQVWFDRRTNYTRSLAVMSMVGYILGLGDRWVNLICVFESLSPVVSNGFILFLVEIHDQWINSCILFFEGKESMVLLRSRVTMPAGGREGSPKWFIDLTNSSITTMARQIIVHL